MIAEADDLKWPVGKDSDVQDLLDFLAEHRLRRDVQIFLQPLSLSPKATAVCIGACYRHGFKLSLQTHKFINLP